MCVCESVQNEKHLLGCPNDRGLDANRRISSTIQMTQSLKRSTTGPKEESKQLTDTRLITYCRRTFSSDPALLHPAACIMDEIHNIITAQRRNQNFF